MSVSSTSVPEPVTPVVVADSTGDRPVPSARPRRLWVWMVPVLLVSAGVAIARADWLSDRQAAAPVVRLLPVPTTTLTPVSSIQVSRAYTGTIEARRTSELGFELGGTVVDLAVDDGDRVEAGAVLAQLDTQALDARRAELIARRSQAAAVLQELEAGPRVEDIAAARANVRDLQEQLALARTRTTRRQALYAEGAISREELDEEAFGTGALQARLEAARSNLSELETGTRQEQVAAQIAAVQQIDAQIAALDVDIQKSTLRAPFAGTVSARQLDEGAIAASGQPVMRLVERDRLEARIGVPVTAARTLAIGSQQSVRVNRIQHSGTVRALLPELDAPTRTVTVVLDLDAGADVSPGEVARLAISDSVPTEGYWLPTTALVRGEQGLWSVYALGQPSAAIESDGDGGNRQRFQLERREVEVLHEDGERVVVRGTVIPGEQVVTGGTHRIVPGQWVTPVSIAGPPAPDTEEAES